MKVFLKCFLAFSIFFGLIYFTAINRGATPIENEELPVLHSFLGITLAIAVCSFWITMLIDFFNNVKLKNKTLWGLSLIFLSWFGAVLYFLTVYLKKGRD